MDIFAQNKLLFKVVILLIVLNLFSIGIFIGKDFFIKPTHENQINNNRDITKVLKKELNLTEEQNIQFRNLRADFFEKEKELSKIIRSERDSMNQEMFNINTNQELIKALAKRIADNEYEMELLRFEQALRLKEICSPDQLEKFQYLVKEIRDYLKPKNK